MDLTRFNYDALIFDCDGTLVNSAPLHFESFRLTFENQGATFEKEWYTQRNGLTRLELITEFSKHAQIAINIHEAVITSESNFLKLISGLEVIKEIADIAHDHRKRMPMAVASSGQRLSVTSSLEAVGLLKLFKYVVTAEDVTEHKPNPAPYLKTAEKLGIAPERCLVFEDTDEGLESARSAGCNVVDVRTIATIYT